MDHVHQFEMGYWLLALAYLTSAVGCAAGLACTRQARYARDPARRLGWFALASVSIGGVGIWVMHFVAMLGFATPGMPVRYDVAITALSAVIAVVSVFIGLVVFGVRRDQFVWWRLLLAGLITGLAVAGMHYTGMLAVRIQGTISYDLALVAVSLGIAVVAATVALWFTVGLNNFVPRLLGGLLMGAAVTGMHYTGMTAMRVRLDAAAPVPSGVEVFGFLFPVFVLAAVALAVPICAVLLTSTPADQPAEQPEQPEETVQPQRPRQTELTG